jgi:hypothetical protein
MGQPMSSAAVQSGDALPEQFEELFKEHYASSGLRHDLHNRL